ncbi:MAG: ATP-binding protein, partial [Chloroflexi bacterium]
FGYGLSLYLVKMEIEAMGGKIWFTSEERVGSTFSFKLQLWQPE